MTQFETSNIPLLAEEGWTRHQTRCREASLCWSGRGGQTGEAPHWRRTTIEASPYRARASRIEASPYRARASRIEASPYRARASRIEASPYRARASRIEASPYRARALRPAFLLRLRPIGLALLGATPPQLRRGVYGHRELLH